MTKSKGFEVICEEIAKSASNNAEYGSWIKDELKKLIAFAKKIRTLAQDELEASAKPFFEKLTSLYQIALLTDNINEESKYN